MTGFPRFGFCSVVLMAAIGCDTPVDVDLHITGRVTLYDELGHKVASAGGVRVTALSPSCSRTYEAFTNTTGRFDLELPDEKGVPLLFSRDGYGDMLRFNVEEETEPIQVGLFARSSAAVTAATAVAESCGTVTCLRLELDVEDFFGPGTTRRLFRVYLGTDPGVSLLDYQFTFLLVVPNDQPGLLRDGSAATFTSGGLHGLLGSFPTGTTVHLVIHGATENLASSYTSPENGLEIFTDLSTASANAAFIIP